MNFFNLITSITISILYTLPNIIKIYLSISKDFNINGRLINYKIIPIINPPMLNPK